MKKFNLILAVLTLAILTIAACKKDRNSVNAASNAKEFTAFFGPQIQNVKINAAVMNSFTLKGGTRIVIPAGTFKKNGTPISGDVNIEAMEFLKRSDILFGGTNTNHISGAPLASDGFIYINATVNGSAVDKDVSGLISISIPAKRNGVTQIWEGVEKVGNEDQMAWQAPAPLANGVNIRREAQPTAGEFTFNMGNLGWINCDVFYSYSNPKTTTRVVLNNNPGALARFRGFSGETFVFFCAKGSSVAAQIYTLDGPNQVKSYDDVMPIGAQGKYISFSIKDGKYYYAELETTITTDQVITLNLAETTQDAVQQAINSLNGY